MSRHGYIDDDGDDYWSAIRWAGAVKSAIRGKRGQEFLRGLLLALDEVGDKVLYPNNFVCDDGGVCALGAFAKKHGIETKKLVDGSGDCDGDEVGAAFGIAPALAMEIMYLNDDGLVDDWDWLEVEICGPMFRPFEQGNHKKSVRVPNKMAPQLRWQRMREWVEKQIMEGA